MMIVSSKTHFNLQLKHANLLNDLCNHFSIKYRLKEVSEVIRVMVEFLQIMIMLAKWVLRGIINYFLGLWECSLNALSYMSCIAEKLIIWC